MLADTVGEDVPHLDLVINSIGTLHDHVTRAERKLEEVSLDSLVWSFRVNTAPTVLLAQNLKKLLLNSERPVFAAISAKVGSIGDNSLGGWHSYRISKSALNMAVKNIAIELARKKKTLCAVAIHPGTTATRLSQPFLESARKKYKVHSPRDTAANIIRVLSGLDPKQHNGSFFSWTGEELPW